MVSETTDYVAEGVMLMAHSAKLDAYAKALAEAQAEMTNPAFDCTNSHYRSKYASLAACLKAVRPVLNAHGIAVSMMPVSDNGLVGCVTQFTHISGQWMRCRLLFKPGKDDIHGQAGAVTYAKRYTLCGMAGVTADDDDDGNSALPEKRFDTSKANGATAPIDAKALTNHVLHWSDKALDDVALAAARRLVIRTALADADMKSEHVIQGYKPTKNELAMAIGWVEKNRRQFPSLQDCFSDEAIEKETEGALKF